MTVLLDVLWLGLFVLSGLAFVCLIKAYLVWKNRRRCTRDVEEVRNLGSILRRLDWEDRTYPGLRPPEEWPRR